jgi:hypothetical protein
MLYELDLNEVVFVLKVYWKWIVLSNTILQPGLNKNDLGIVLPEVTTADKNNCSKILE